MKENMKIKIFVTTVLLSISISSYANETVNNIYNSVNDKWERAMAGQDDLYLPMYTWHNRSFYDREKINSFNENPWGIGFGKSYKDENRNWHGFYAMAFSDSHYKVEPIAGYGYTKNWYKNDFSLGAGYTVFLTARSDIKNYLPFPAILPLVSVSYKNFSLMGTYLPGSHNNGNIAFIWGRYQFE